MITRGHATRRKGGEMRRRRLDDTTQRRAGETMEGRKRWGEGGNDEEGERDEDEDDDGKEGGNEGDEGQTTTPRLNTSLSVEWRGIAPITQQSRAARLCSALFFSLFYKLPFMYLCTMGDPPSGIYTYLAQINV